MTVSATTIERRLRFDTAAHEFLKLPSTEHVDREIQIAVENKLQNSSYGSVRRVDCTVRDGAVTLFGSVPSYHMKQVVQTLAARVPCVIRVSNHCEVLGKSPGSGSADEAV